MIYNVMLCNIATYYVFSIFALKRVKQHDHTFDSDPTPAVCWKVHVNELQSKSSGNSMNYWDNMNIELQWHNDDHIHMCIHITIHGHSQRERGRERERESVCVCVFVTDMCVCAYRLAPVPLTHMTFLAYSSGNYVRWIYDTVDQAFSAVKVSSCHRNVKYIRGSQQVLRFCPAGFYSRTCLEIVGTNIQDS